MLPLRVAARGKWQATRKNKGNLNRRDAEDEEKGKGNLTQRHPDSKTQRYD